MGVLKRVCLILLTSFSVWCVLAAPAATPKSVVIKPYSEVQKAKDVLNAIDPPRCFA